MNSIRCPGSFQHLPNRSPFLLAEADYMKSSSSRTSSYASKSALREEQRVSQRKEIRQYTKRTLQRRPSRHPRQAWRPSVYGGQMASVYCSKCQKRNLGFLTFFLPPTEALASFCFSFDKTVMAVPIFLTSLSLSGAAACFAISTANSSYSGLE
jgi:hypothetical protein